MFSKRKRGHKDNAKMCTQKYEDNAKHEHRR